MQESLLINFQIQFPTDFSSIAFKLVRLNILIILQSEMIKSTVFLLCVVALVTGLHIDEEQHEQTTSVLYPGRVTIKGYRGNYIVRCNGCGPSITGLYDTAAINKNSITGPWAYWLVEVYGNKVAFKGDNGKYLARCTNCWVGGKYADSVFVHMTTPTGPALWTVQATNVNGMYRFKADTGKYLGICQNNCVPGYTQDYAFAEGSVTTQGITFAVNFIFPTSGKINLLSDVNTYLARCNGCGPSPFPDSASLHVTDPNVSSAIWTVEAAANGKVAFKSDSGKYLARCTNCWIGGFPPDSAFVHVPSTSDPAALWTPISLFNGKWAFRSDLGRHLAVCTWCVAAVYPNFAFAHVDSPSEGPWAHWQLRIR